MKIGIFTFHFANNYGAMLQAYALSTKLCSMGYDAEIVDYRLPFIYRKFEIKNNDIKQKISCVIKNTFGDKTLEFIKKSLS